MSERLATWWDRAVYLAIIVLAIIVVWVAVGYDIYQTPPDAHYVHSATIEISGRGHFHGEVGTVSNPYTVKGTVSRGKPLSIEIPYRRADSVSAYIQWTGTAGTTKIQVDCQTVDESVGHAVEWKVPRSWKGGRPPNYWPTCHQPRHVSRHWY